MTSLRMILLIEDDAAIRTMTRRLLVEAGYAVQEADDGKAGLAYYNQRRFDAVITDIVMPDKEGLETIRELRRADPLVKIIAMSGAGGQGHGGYLEIALKLGAHRILHKPFTSDALLAIVGEVLAK